MNERSEKINDEMQRKSTHEAEVIQRPSTINKAKEDNYFGLSERNVDDRLMDA